MSVSGKPRRIGRRTRLSGISDVRKFERTRFGRRPISWRKGRVVAGAVLLLAGVVAVTLAVW